MQGAHDFAPHIARGSAGHDLDSVHDSFQAPDIVQRLLGNRPLKER
jgi:hypothetical protein